MTMPTKTLLQGKVYVPSHQTDIRKTFTMEKARIAAFYRLHQQPKEKQA